MRSFRKSLTILAIFAFTLLCNSSAFAWTLPIASGYRVTNGFWSCGLACFHLGDDVAANENDSVLSIGEGHVVEVKYSAANGNYGGRVLVEYENNGNPIVVLYAHMGKNTDNPETDDIFVSVGDFVENGQTIGRIGGRHENGGWGTHLHIGINRGRYAGTRSVCGRWLYAGYTAETYSPSNSCYCDVMNNWYDPSEFLSVRAKEMRIVDASVSPDNGYIGETFTWRLSAQGGRRNPITANVIIRSPIDGIDRQFPMNYVAGTESPFEFTYTAAPAFTGTYYYGFLLETCADRVRESVWRSGPEVGSLCEGTIEICDNADNDCDDDVDEGVWRGCSNECGNTGTQTCTRGVWGTCGASACTPPAPPSPPPPPACIPSTEVCDNTDNDCDTRVDEEIALPCSNECGNTGIQICASGWWNTCNATACPPPPPLCTPHTEVCDNADNNCNDRVDESVWRGCSNECGNIGTETCSAGTWSECNATLCPPPPAPPTPPVPPPPPACIPYTEICDNADNNCNGRVDEDVLRSCLNECGNAGTQTCYSGSWNSCNASACPPPTPPIPPTTPPATPAVPSLISPANQEIIRTPLGTSTSVVLNWSSVANATQYEYQIRFGGFAESGALVEQNLVAGTSRPFSTTFQNYGVEFKWKVRAIGSGGVSAWSEIRNFFFSYPAGTLIQCESSDCPSRHAIYTVSSNTYNMGISGVPSMLIIDWIGSTCLRGRSFRAVNFSEIAGYQRSARYDGCPP